MEDYGEILDEGRPASSGSGSGEVYEGILQWLKYPNVVERLKGKFKGLKLGMSDEELSVFARPITRAIHSRGYPAKNWIQPAFDKVTPNIEKVVEAAVLDDLEISFDQIKQIIERK